MTSPSLLYADCEGTGLDPENARIVEISLHRPDEELTLTFRVNPGVPIPPEATAVHGIRDEDVADAPRFDEIALPIQVELTRPGVVLTGYSLTRYDTLLIDTELRRAGQPGIPRDGNGRFLVPELDLYELWLRSEPRTLVGAAARFAGVELKGAHSAEADTHVLPAVLAGMSRAFGLEGKSVDELLAMCADPRQVDRDRKFLRREDGVVVFGFAKVKDAPVHSDPGFLRWMLKKDFSTETRAYAERFLQEIEAAEAEELAAIEAEQGSLFDAAPVPGEPPALVWLDDDDLPF